MVVTSTHKHTSRHGLVSGTISVACEDDDSLSLGNGSNASSSNHDPIVVAYAFGPKKMKSMGVVMAEASRVSVIHEVVHSFPTLLPEGAFSYTPPEGANVLEPMG